MFTIRVHSVDTDHPLFLSPPSTAAASATASNPKLTERRGVVHLFRTLSRHPTVSHPSTVATRSTLLLIVAIPNYFSSSDLLRFFGPRISDVSELVIIRNDGMEDRYSALIRTESQASADAFYCHFNGKRFSPPEVEICHVLFLLEAEFTELAEIASLAPIGYAELPTCPICLERLDQDTSGIQNTLCDHSFQCSCVSKWTYLSCQVCRQDENPTCSVCDTSENLWICVICGFIGCGRYKEGHTIRHCKETQHIYSLELGTQKVWDYVGDNYVHRLNQSKVDGKSVTVNSHCMSFDGDCGTCASEDSDIGGALFDSKVEAIMDEYNHLLATQLENQREYYETKLAEAKSQKDNLITKAVETAASSRMQDLQSKIRKRSEEKDAVANRNQILMKNQEALKGKLKETIESGVSTLRSKDEKILDLKEQIRDIKIYIQAQSTFKNMSDSDDIKGGTVLPVPLAEPSSPKTKRRIKHGRKRN